MTGSALYVTTNVFDKSTTVMEIKEHGQFAVNDLAHEQMAARLDIPRRYYDRLRTNSPDLFDLNVNHWLMNMRTGKLNQRPRYMVRTLDGTARATELERLGGEVIELTPQQWRTLAVAV